MFFALFFTCVGCFLFPSCFIFIFVLVGFTLGVFFFFFFQVGGYPSQGGF